MDENIRVVSAHNQCPCHWPTSATQDMLVHCRQAPSCLPTWGPQKNKLLSVRHVFAEGIGLLCRAIGSSLPEMSHLPTSDQLHMSLQQSAPWTVMNSGTHPNFTSAWDKLEPDTETQLLSCLFPDGPHC